MWVMTRPRNPGLNASNPFGMAATNECFLKCARHSTENNEEPKITFFPVFFLFFMEF